MEETKIKESMEIIEKIKNHGFIHPYYNTRSMGYANDLDRFIDGQIGFEEIQDYIKEDVSVQDSIMDAYKMKASDSKVNHDLCEKLCYASVLYNMGFFSPHGLYAIYLTARNNCSPHKLNWDCLLEKIKKELEMTDEDMEHGKCIYEDYQERGGRCYVLPPDDDY